MEKQGANKIYVSEHYRTSIVAVDSYSDTEFIGRLYNPFYENVVRVVSFHQLIKELDNLMDEIGCPMSGMGKRSFANLATESQRAKMIENDMTVPKGKKATFAIRTQYRNNASWQGTVKWLERETDEYFRSLLDLFWLMDSAMITE